MPFRHHAARRRRIPRARYRVRNRRQYEAGLKRRGDLTLWLDEADMAGWQAPRRTTPGGQAWYSDAAIELVLALRLVCRFALRQAEGFAASVLRLLGRDLRVPDHTTLMWTAGIWQSPFAILRCLLAIDQARRPLPTPHCQEHRRGVRGPGTSMKFDADSLCRA